MSNLKMCLNHVDKKDGEPGPRRNSIILKDKSIGDKLRRPNLVKKIILRGSVGQKKTCFSQNFGGGYKLDVAN